MVHGVGRISISASNGDAAEHSEPGANNNAEAPTVRMALKWRPKRTSRYKNFT